MNEDMELIIKQRGYVDATCSRFRLNYTEMARQVGIAHTTLTRLFAKDAKNALSSTTLNKISRHYGVEPFKFGSGKVPLVGHVGAGGEVILYSESQIKEMVEAPTEAAEEGAVALDVHGDSMWPAYKNGDRIFYVKICDFDTSYVGKDCVIELQDGRVLLKILRRGAMEGLFNLDSYNQPPMENIKIKWACPVKWQKRF